MKLILAKIKDFKIGGRIVNKVRFADVTNITTNIQEELEEMVNGWDGTESKYGVEINITNHK